MTPNDSNFISFTLLPELYASLANPLAASADNPIKSVKTDTSAITDLKRPISGLKAVPICLFKDVAVFKSSAELIPNLLKSAAIAPRFLLICLV